MVDHLRPIFVHSCAFTNSKQHARAHTLSLSLSRAYAKYIYALHVTYLSLDPMNCARMASASLSLFKCCHTLEFLCNITLVREQWFIAIPNN